MTQRYRDKVSQWENSQEALDQLTDELQANLNLLEGSQRNVDRLKDQIGTLQEQVETLKQQVSAAQTYTHNTEEASYPFMEVLVPWHLFSLLSNPHQKILETFRPPQHVVFLCTA